MAQFDPAYTKLIKHEGGYANDPDNHGGETYRGISRNNWRGWEGWAQIDKLKQGKDFPHCLNINADLQGSVRAFYRRNFWTPLMDEIQDQPLVNWLFDKCVNMGSRRAYKLMQRALHVDEDGVIGQETKHGIHQMDPALLLAACREEAKRFYTKLALDDPTQAKFLRGWLGRA